MLAVLSESLAANAQINIRVYRCISPTDTALINLINCVSGRAREHFPRKFSGTLWFLLLCQIIFSLVNILCPFQYEKGLLSILMFSVVAASKIQVRKGGHSDNCLGRGIKSGSLLGL